LIAIPNDQQLQTLLTQVQKEVQDYFEKNKLGPFPNVCVAVQIPEEAKHLSESGLRRV